MKRVLVTGASGFIGQYTLEPLVSQGFGVHAVFFSKPGKSMPGVTWHQANLLDKTETSCLLRDVCPTHLLHLAWYAEPGKYWRSTENFRWLESSISLLQSFRENGGERVVMAGTCAEYDWSYGFCSELITPCQPATPYGICKKALRETLNSYSSLEGLSSAWGRIFFLYGPGENQERLVPSVINALLNNEPVRCSHGEQIRDFLYVEDVGEAFVALLDSEVEGPVNIGSGVPTSVKSLVYSIGDKLRNRSKIKLGAIDLPADDPPLLVADITRLKNEVGWLPKVNIENGIEISIEYWRRRFS